jgi:hypothetical protein
MWSMPERDGFGSFAGVESAARARGGAPTAAAAAAPTNARRESG